MATPFKKIYKDQLDTLEHLRERMSWARANARAINKVGAKIEKIAASVKDTGAVFSRFMMVDSVYDKAKLRSTPGLFVGINISNANGLREREVTDTIETLEALGFVFDDTFDYNHIDAPARSFRGQGEVFGVMTSVNLDVIVRTDSPTCRKVQVGVKTVQVPEYEIQCD